MRDLFLASKFLAIKKFSLVAALGIAFGLLAFGPAAQAASLFEKNFWLSGPRYDGKPRPVYFSIIEDGGFAGFTDGVEFCVVGLDRNWAFNPACKAARP